jgi:hypothetical protein
MSGEGLSPMNVRGPNRRSLESVAALNRIPLDETEQLLEAVSIGVISEDDARSSIYAEGIRQHGVY